nr:unnamed protein product [Callosobruchus analis]
MAELGLIAINERRQPTFWTHEIACLRRDCLRARRAYTKRNLPEHERHILGLSYKQAKKKLGITFPINVAGKEEEYCSGTFPGSSKSDL